MITTNLLGRRVRAHVGYPTSREPEIGTIVAISYSNMPDDGGFKFLIARDDGSFTTACDYNVELAPVREGASSEPFNEAAAREAIREIREAKVISCGMSDRAANQLEAAITKLRSAHSFGDSDLSELRVVESYLAGSERGAFRGIKCMGDHLVFERDGVTFELRVTRAKDAP